jgi:hypothetical protein
MCFTTRPRCVASGACFSLLLGLLLQQPLSNAADTCARQHMRVISTIKRSIVRHFSLRCGSGCVFTNSCCLFAFSSTARVLDPQLYGRIVQSLTLHLFCTRRSQTVISRWLCCASSCPS